MLIINANLHPMDGPAIPAGWLRFGRTIEALGPMETCPAASLVELIYSRPSMPFSFCSMTCATVSSSV